MRHAGEGQQRVDLWHRQRAREDRSAAGLRPDRLRFAHQNWQDGDAKINHWGMPARPYFIAEDDFRKSGSGGSQGDGRHSAMWAAHDRVQGYNCIYALEPATTFWIDRHAGAWTRVRTVNDMTCSREMDWLPCYTQSGGQTDAPFFFSVGFEMNGVAPDVAPANRLYMEYLARRSQNTKLVFATPSAVVDFFKRHYDRTPESVFIRLILMSALRRAGNQPVVRDTMEIENDRSSRCF